MSKSVVFFLLVIAPASSLCLALLGLETLAENHLGWFLLALGIVYPAGGAIYYFIHRRPFWEASDSGRTMQFEKADRSFWAILPGFLVAFFAPPLEWVSLSSFLPRTIVMEVAGAGIILLGSVLLVWARLCLRGFYSGRISVGSQQALVQNGPYQIIRHPSYAGMVLVALGVALGYASWIGLLAIFVFLLPGFVYRILVEERLLSARFGEEFRRYRSNTKRLVPGIW